MKPVEHSDRAKSRFWAKVAKGADDECWLWTAGVMPRGYGHFRSGGASIPKTYAHRFSYEIHHGPIPEGMFVCHRCDVPGCVNPAHLFIGSNIDNIMDMVSKGRQASGDRNGARARPDKIKRGSDRAFAKLTDDDVCAIRSEYMTGKVTQAALAARFGLSRSAVYFVTSRKKWRHLK